MCKGFDVRFLIALQLGSDVARVSQLYTSPSGTCAMGPVALCLRAMGYEVVVRKVLDSREYWTKSMTNTFICCLHQSPEGCAEYVVDPNFKELFRVAYMSDPYRCVRLGWMASALKA